MLEQVITPYTSMITNKALMRETSQIIKCANTAQNDIFKMCALIKSTYDNKNWCDDFASFVDYGQDVLGFKKSSLYNFLKIGTEYIDHIEGTKDKYATILPHGEQDFTAAQITALLPLGVECAMYSVNKGVITPEMSVREIKKLVKEIKQPVSDTDTDTDTDIDTDTDTDIAENVPVFTTLYDSDGNEYHIPAELNINQYRI